MLSPFGLSRRAVPLLCQLVLLHYIFIHMHALLQARRSSKSKGGRGGWVPHGLSKCRHYPKFSCHGLATCLPGGVAVETMLKVKRMLVAKVLTIALDICDANCESPIGTVLELADGGVVCPALKENSLNGLALSLASGLYPAYAITLMLL